MAISLLIHKEKRTQQILPVDTHYAPFPEEATVVKLIFEKIGIEGWSTSRVADYLELLYPPPGKYKHWESTQVKLFVRNPLYKGEFVANRFKEIMVPARKQRPFEPVKKVKKKIQRPQSEWIIVPVEPLVSEELWQQANLMLEKNRTMSSRHAKDGYLLSGLVYCACCGYTYCGGRKTHYLKGGDTISRFYRPTARSNRGKGCA